MMVCGAYKSESKFIYCTVLVLETIWSILWWEQPCMSISARAGPINRGVALDRSYRGAFRECRWVGMMPT